MRVSSLVQSAAWFCSVTSAQNVFTQYWNVTPPLDYDDPLYAGWQQIPYLAQVEVYNGVAEGRTYSHHPQVYACGSHVYLTHSSALVDEDSMGQDVRFSQSVDGGKTWSAPHSILPPALLPSQTNQANFSYWCGQGIQQRALQPDGFVELGGLLYATAQTTDFWCEPGIASGDHAAGQVTRPLYFNGTIAGPPCWLIKDQYTKSVGYPETVYGTKYGMKMCKNATAINAIRKKPANVPPWSDFLYNDELYAADFYHTMQEPTYATWIASEKTWQRFWRDTSGGSENSMAVWVEYSKTGLDWYPVVQHATHNQIYQTNIPNGETKEFLLSVPAQDLRVLISNPRNNSELVRQPLTMTTSRGSGFATYNSAQVLRTNASTDIVPDTRDYKNLGFQYPAAVRVGDTVVVAYSENKQNIWVSVVALKDLM